MSLYVLLYHTLMETTINLLQFCLRTAVVFCCYFNEPLHSAKPREGVAIGY